VEEDESHSTDIGERRGTTEEEEAEMKRRPSRHGRGWYRENRRGGEQVTRSGGKCRRRERVRETEE